MIFAFKDCLKNATEKKLKPRIHKITESSHFDTNWTKKINKYRK